MPTFFKHITFFIFVTRKYSCHFWAVIRTTRIIWKLFALHHQ